MDAVTIVNASLATVLAIGTIAGLIKGLLRQAIELIGIVGSFFLAILFAGWLAAILEEHVSLPYSPYLVIAFLALLIGGIIGFHFVAISLQKLVRMTFLGWVDRLCGAMVGLMLAMLVGSSLVGVALELPVSRDARRAIEKSEVGMYLRPMAPWLFDVVFSHGDGGVSFEKIFKGGGPI